jgi:multiple sugar transport system substrate-binding protein
MRRTLDSADPDLIGTARGVRRPYTAVAIGRAEEVSMRRSLAAVAAAAMFVFASCSSGSTPAPAGSGAAASGGGASAAASTSYDPSSVSGTVTFSGWQASPEEGVALKAALDGFKAKYPNITVNYSPISGDYASAMAAKFSAHQPPDVFYVDSSVAPDWISQGLLAPLDDWSTQRGFDTSQFYPGYLDAFKGTDGKIYGFPKDGNTIALAYNSDLLTAAGITTPPATWDDLVADAPKLSTGGKHAFCLSSTLDRALAFIYQGGGGLLSEDKKSSVIDSDASKAAIKWYLDLFKNGWGARPADLGDDWCGKALGEGKVAMIFEGGWLDPFMKAQYPKIKYAWAPMPKGQQDATLGFTVSYSIGTDSPNKDQAWVLLTYLTGPEGMKLWTQGGVANPSRKDVTAPAGKEVLVNGAANAKPWSFIPGFSKIQEAFNNAMTAAIEKKSDDPTDVSAKTKAAIDSALNQ